MSNLAQQAQDDASRTSNVLPMEQPTRWHFTIRHAMVTALVLPLLVIGAGFLLWVAPGRQIYGQVLSRELSPWALIEPGMVYMGVMILSATFAVMVGIERLQRPLRYLSRTTLVVADIAFWFIVAVVSTRLAYDFTYGKPFGVILDPASTYCYMLVHVIVVGFGLRRLYGLLRSRLAAPIPDRRRVSPGLRVLQACLAMALLFAQAPLAILFGALGPNPAKRVHPVAIQMRSDVVSPFPNSSKRWMFYIDRNSERVLGYDHVERRVVEIPQDRIAEIQWAKTPQGVNTISTN